jgi:hypothetical protein
MGVVRKKGGIGVHERKVLFYKELGIGCPRLSVHVHGQMRRETAPFVAISCLCTRIYSRVISQNEPLLSTHVYGQNIQRKSAEERVRLEIERPLWRLETRNLEFDGRGVLVWRTSGKMELLNGSRPAGERDDGEYGRRYFRSRREPAGLSPDR